MKPCYVEKTTLMKTNATLTKGNKMIQKKNLSDSELLLNAIHDKSYLSELSNRYYRPLSNFVMRFVKDKETSEDIVQETFLRCMRHSHKYPDIEKVSNWLFTISANLARTELRRRKRWCSISIHADEDDQQVRPFEPIASVPQPDAQVGEQQIKTVINKSIDSLPKEYREAIMLRDIGGCSYEEISRTFCVPIGTVKSRVNRGRIRLRGPLQKLAEEVMGSQIAIA
tara:strand:+ start:11799 stop:12476 length:678 start_codon:yes stop_codon:yes gene_type:complete